MHWVPYLKHVWKIYSNGMLELVSLLAKQIWLAVKLLSRKLVSHIFSDGKEKHEHCLRWANRQLLCEAWKH